MPLYKDELKYKHLKTGNIYYAIGEVLNATNEQDGQTMILYYRDGKNDASDLIFVRETEEFHSKFERVIDD